jgi:voltage-gated potassium channel
MTDDMISSPLRKPVPLVWQGLILLLSIAVLVELSVSILVPLPLEIKRLFDIADTGICVLFMSDFLLLLYLHKNRTKYFFTWGWLDLLSSIPLLDTFRWGRLARIIRLLRLFRGLRNSTGLLRRMFSNKRETTIVAIILTVLSVAVFSSLAILVAEDGSGSPINSAEKAVWWALTTMTTVGYGDLTPITTLGRSIAVLTMFAGIGVFGAFSAVMASFLVQQKSSSEFQNMIMSRLDSIEETLRKEKEPRQD